MGYYTNYKLYTDSENPEIINNFITEYYLDFHWHNNVWYYNAKWYDHEKELKEYSIKYPDVLFTLEGEGEENGDIWKLYVKNGKSQCVRAIITFDNYSEDRLK